jgi:hypothetical protein
MKWISKKLHGLVFEMSEILIISLKAYQPHVRIHRRKNKEQIFKTKSRF